MTDRHVVGGRHNSVLRGSAKFWENSHISTNLHSLVCDEVFGALYKLRVWHSAVISVHDKSHIYFSKLQSRCYKIGK